MKRIITTLTAVTFALGLAAVAQAQVAKTPEKPVVQSTQAVQPQVAPKDAAKPGEPVVKETVKPGDKTKEAVTTGDKTKETAPVRGQRQGQARGQEGDPESQGREEGRRSRGNDQREREVIPGRQTQYLPLTQTDNPGLTKSPT